MSSKDGFAKIRLTCWEAEYIAKAVDQQPGESLAAALKRYFNTQNHTKKVYDDGTQPK